ncbi:MAG: ATP-dependent DNA helicase RecG, partial [Clostridia bacterium]|nr:ATP-dependent DNA helicase RecG [Clostridia bacterium]
MFMDYNVSTLKGVGPKRVEQFERLDVHTVYDLLYHFPRYYIDLNDPISLKDAPLNEQCVVKARVVRKMNPARIRQGLTVYKVIMTDDTADITVVIYNAGYMYDSIDPEGEYYLVGKITGSGIRREMNSPQMYSTADADMVQPVYRLTEGIT